MHSSEIPKLLPTPDDLVISLLQFLGITNTAVLALVVLGFSLKAWLPLLQSGYSTAEGALTGAAQRVATLGPISGLVAILVSVIVLIAQAAALVPVYVLGNFLSVIFELPALGGWDEPGQPAVARLRSFQAAWDNGGAFGVLDGAFLSSLRIDLASGIVMAIAIVGLLAAYGSDGRGWMSCGVFAALPFPLWLPLAVLSIPNYLGAAPGSTAAEEAATLFMSGVVCVAYTLLLMIGSRASQLSADVWRHPT